MYAFQVISLHLSLWEFQSLDKVKTLVYMEVCILNRLLSLEEYFILNIVEDKMSDLVCDWLDWHLVHIYILNEKFF